MIRIIAALALAFVASTASAETPWEVLERFGLTGTWAASCDRASTRQNFFETFSRGPNGAARRDVDRGAEVPIAASFIESAEILSQTTLRFRIRNSDPNWGRLNNLTYDVVFIKEDDPRTKEPIRIRGLESAVSDGRIIAKGGMLLSIAKPTYWQYKCRMAISARGSDWRTQAAMLSGM